MAETGTEYTRGERAAGIFGLLLFAALALIAADLAFGGRVLSRKKPCGCPDQEAAGDSGA